MDPISTARYGLMAASRSLDASAVNIAAMGVDGAPEVDMADETVNLIQAKTAFSANVQVIRFAQDMWESLLHIQAR